MVEMPLDIRVLDLPEVKALIKEAGKQLAALEIELDFLREHGRPWAKPDMSMVGQKFLMWTNHNTMLTGPLTKDFIKSGFVVAVQPYPTPPNKWEKARRERGL